jgi:hypothetical protein
LPKSVYRNIPKMKRGRTFFIFFIFYSTAVISIPLNTRGKRVIIQRMIRIVLAIHLLLLLPAIGRSSHAFSSTTPTSSFSSLLTSNKNIQKFKEIPTTVKSSIFTTFVQVDAAPLTSLSVGTSNGILNDVVSNGAVKPPWSLTGDSNLAIDVADYQSSLSFYVTNNDDQTRIKIHNIDIRTGTLLQVKTTIRQPVVQRSAPTSSVDVSMSCSGSGRSHVTVTIYGTMNNNENSVIKLTEFRYKKRCSELNRPGLNIGTNHNPSNFVHGGHVQLNYRKPAVLFDQSNGTYIQLSIVLEQLALGTAEGTQKFLPTIINVEGGGVGHIDGPFSKTVEITKHVRNDFNVIVYCTYNSRKTMPIEIIMTPEPVYQVRRAFAPFLFFFFIATLTYSNHLFTFFSHMVPLRLNGCTSVVVCQEMVYK